MSETKLMTANEVLTDCGLDWKLKKETVRSSEGHILHDKQLLVREDNGFPLAVVGNNYRVVQNEEALHFFDMVTADPGGAKYDKALTIFNGRKTMYSCTLPDFIEVVKGDVIQEHIVLANFHDGSGRLTMMWNGIRLFCANQFPAIMRRAGDNIFRMKHTTNNNVMSYVTQAQTILGLSTEMHTKMEEVLGYMVTVEPTKSDIENVLMKLFPPLEPVAVYSELPERTKNVHNKVLDLYEKGRGTDTGSNGTAYGLFNAVTEYVNHEKIVRNKYFSHDDARVNDVMFGRGNTLMHKALNVCASLK